MGSEDLCRKCCFPTREYASNMTYDKNGNYIRCPRCQGLERKFDQQRTAWNQRVVYHVKRLDPELQDYYRYDLEHGDLRKYLITMREGGKSPTEAVRAWRHKVMYIDATAARTQKTPNRSGSPRFQYETVPQRQYRQPADMPLLFASPREVITRPEMSVIYAPPAKIIMLASELPRTYSPDSDSDDSSESGSESSSESIHGHFSGVVRDRHGRVAVVVRDSHGRKAKGRSVLAYFTT